MADKQGDSRGEARQSFYAKQLLIESARNAFQQLAAILKNATLYPAAHPHLLAAADKFRGKIEELLVERKEVAFFLVGGELFFEKISIPIDQALSLLLEQFTTRDVGGIVFIPGLTTEELVRFAGLMNKEPAYLTGKGGIHTVIEKEGIPHIVLHNVVLVEKKNMDLKGKKRASEVFKDAVETVQEMVQAIHFGQLSSARKVNSVVQTMVDNILDNRDALMGLTSLKMYDEYTFAHCVNTSILAASLGTFLSFDKPQIAILAIAGLMHDIGKASVPLEITNKPGKLTDEEWNQMKRHPVEGALLLVDNPGVSKLAMVAAFEHHQHGGGMGGAEALQKSRGYPQVTIQHERHPFSQIVALADAYEALTAARVYYSSRISPDQSIRILIKNRGVTSDPVLLKAFINMVGIFPIGTLLKLDTGEIGLVMHQTRDLMRPRVLILTRFDGSEKETQDISLLETAGGRYQRSAVGTIDPNTTKINISQYLG
jgi:HD-GYP domain-containing protein (c-di-GMP phosphodiesterase class II)